MGRKVLVGLLDRAISEREPVIVFNAQSGWGKSSLALKFAGTVAERNGHAVVMDSRTASSPRYVTEVLRRSVLDAQAKRILVLPSDSNWASLSAALATIQRATWIDTSRPLLVFFDQFENVFRSTEVTRAFRDLALGAREITHPFTVGFAWKTDLVGWIEGHPYQLRDEIRSAAATFVVEPFGSTEVTTIIDRLQRKSGTKLNRDLRDRLREYSQGLPWLLKKLADHVLKELAAGSSQEVLVSEALNVQNLFDGDLAELGPEAVEILKHVARFAPIQASEVTDRYSPEAVQSLVDRRLVVQVGDRLDTYWDIFRDYLNTGRIPLEDSYILRSAPNQIARMLPLVMRVGGMKTVADLVAELDTSVNVISNLSRDSRLLGITSFEPLKVRISSDVVNAPDPESAARDRVTTSLRRHRAFSAFQEMAARNDGVVSVDQFAQALSRVFPAVSAAESTWTAYARVFFLWFEYAGLVARRGDGWTGDIEGSQATKQLLLSVRTAIRSRASVPQESPRYGLALLSRVGRETVQIPAANTPEREALLTLANLGAVTVDASNNVVLTKAGLVSSTGDINPSILLDCLRRVPGGTAAVDLLLTDGGASPQSVGELIRDRTKATWTPGSTRSIGGYFRAWAKEAGVAITFPRRNAVEGKSE